VQLLPVKVHLLGVVCVCVCVCVCFWGLMFLLLSVVVFLCKREKRKVVVVVVVVAAAAAVADCSYHHLLHMPKFALITFVSGFWVAFVVQGIVDYQWEDWTLSLYMSVFVCVCALLTFSPSLCV
jgi:hypothetical protein